MLRPVVPDRVHPEDLERVVVIGPDDPGDISLCCARSVHKQAEMGAMSPIVLRPGAALWTAGMALAMMAQVAVSPCVPPGTLI